MDAIKRKWNQIKFVAQVSTATGLAAIDYFTAKGALYKNMNFRLVHANLNAEDGSVSMALVTPAIDRSALRQVEAQGFYALSHLWGYQEELGPWTDHGITDDANNGEVVQVDMRLEKRQTILRLLREYPGFWWIDVFCAQSDTPLVIMGDIYRLSTRCFALVDFSSTGFDKVKSVHTWLSSSEPDTDVIQEEYRRRIKKKMGTKTVLWNELLEDLLGGWYTGNTSDLIALAGFLGCRWFTRVWTLQEFLLPPWLTFIGEHDADTVTDTLDRPYVVGIMEKILNLLKVAHQSYMTEVSTNSSADDGGGGGGPRYLGLNPEQYTHATTSSGVSRCYSDLTALYAACEFFLFICQYDEVDNPYPLLEGFIISRMRNVSSTLDPFGRIVGTLAMMPRVCADPCDYIYGVAGLLQMDIPRTTNPDQVWVSFVEIARKRAPYCMIPDTFDLSKAISMKDAFREISLGDPEAFSKWAESYEDIAGMI